MIFRSPQRTFWGAINKWLASRIDEVSWSCRLTAGLVRGKPGRTGLGLDLSRHHAFGTRPEPDQDILPGAQFRHAIPPQRFHVDKDIGRPLPAGQEAEPAKPVEPFYLSPFQPAGRSDADMGSRRQHLRWMDRRRLVHRDDAEGLIAFCALHTLANDTGSLIGRLVAV